MGVEVVVEVGCAEGDGEEGEPDPGADCGGAVSGGGGGGAGGGVEVEGEDVEEGVGDLGRRGGVRFGGCGGVGVRKKRERESALMGVSSCVERLVFL